MPVQTPYEAFFTLDTGTHNHDIQQLALTPDGRYLLSSGECTIRVWDLANRRMLRRLLGRVAERAEEVYGLGNVNRFATSPDGRWVLALKDWALPAARRGGKRQRVTELQVFELATGNLRSSFQAPGEWQDLDISPDGQWLALCGSRTARGVCHSSLAVYRAKAVLQAGFGPAPAPVCTLPLGRSEATDELGGPMTALRFVPAPAPPRGRPGPAHRLVLVAQGVKGSRGNEAGKDTLSWFGLSHDGALTRTAHVISPQGLTPYSLAVSADLAVVAGSNSPRPDGRMGQFVAYRHDGAWHSRTATDSQPAALAFNALGSQLIVGLAPARAPLKPTKGRQRQPAPLGLGVLPQHGPETVISASTHGWAPLPGEQTVPVHAYAVGVDGMTLSSSYFGHDSDVRALAVQTDGTVWSSGGDNRAIHAWSAQHRMGEFLHALRGVGRLCAMPGVSEDEQVLFGTLPQRLLPPGYPVRQQRFCLRTMRLLSASPTEVQRADFKTDKWVILAWGAMQSIPLRHNADAKGANVDLPPDLSLFVGANDEWLLWSRSGFFRASAQGAKLAGYHVSRGAQQEALFLPADRFKDFDRPDLIKAIVRHGTQAGAEKAGIRFPVLRVEDMLPPTVEWVKAVARSGGTLASLAFTVEDTGGLAPPQRVWVLANDRFMWEAPVPKRSAQRGTTTGRTKHRFSLTLPLRPGANVFTVLAETASAKSLPLQCSLEGATPQGQADALDTPGRLHLLSVGVSNFAVADTEAAGGFKRLKYAHRDAIAVHNALAQSHRSVRHDPSRALRNKAFESVEAHLLVDAQATKAAVMDALRTLCNSIQQRSSAAGSSGARDVLMVFLSGHGARYSGEQDLYFFNYDLVPADLAETGLSLIDLGQLMTSVAAEVVLVIDACYSASAGDDVVGGLDPEELAQRIHALNERGLYVMSAARAEEKARESSAAGQGVLTAALLAALDTRRFFEAEAPDRPAPVLRAMGLMHALQALVPEISFKAQQLPQTAVCRTYGDLLPLTLFKP